MREWSDIAVLAPSGDVDISTVPALRAEVDVHIAGGARRIIVNCEHVGFIDSTGLAFLLTYARRLMREGGLLSLVNTSAAVSRFLQIARLVDVLHVTAADRPPIPALSPTELPRWSKSIALKEGVEHLGQYRHRLVRLLEGLPLSENARYDTALAASEALGNAYDHAGGVGCVLNVRAYRDRVIIEVCDCGEGFELAADEEPEEQETRGRGIKLMRLLVDSVEIRRRHDARGTMTRLIKLWGTTPI